MLDSDPEIIKEGIYVITYMIPMAVSLLGGIYVLEGVLCVTSGMYVFIADRHDSWSNRFFGLGFMGLMGIVIIPVGLGVYALGRWM